MSSEAESRRSTPWHLLTFRVNERVLALPVEVIEQVVSMVKLTPLPQAEAAVLGAFNVRGRVTAAVSLRQLLGLPEVALGLNTPIVLIRAAQTTLGLVVDEVLDVIEVPPEEVHAPEELLPAPAPAPDAIHGIVTRGTRVIPILVVGQLFDPQQVEALCRLIDALADAADEVPV